MLLWKKHKNWFISNDKSEQGVWELTLQKYRIIVYIRRNTLTCAILYRIYNKIKTVLFFFFTEERTATEAFYEFTCPIHFLFLYWCTVSFKKQHLSALPFLSPSRRVPAGKSTACQKWVRSMKIYKCEFHEAWCSYHAIYFCPLKHCKYLASTPHVVHLIPVAITARVQL